MSVNGHVLALILNQLQLKIGLLEVRLAECFPSRKMWQTELEALEEGTAPHPVQG